MAEEVLVVLGGGPEQIPIIEEASRLGIQTAAFDRDGRAPAALIANHFFPISSAEPLSIIRTLKASNFRPIGVITLGSDVSLSVSLIQDYFALVGNSVRSAERVTNKREMKRSFSEFGVPTPNYFLTSQVSDPYDTASEFGRKVVVKPVDGRGSRGVQLVDLNEHGALETAITASINASQFDYAIVEEYVDGQQFSSEGILIDGDYKNIIVSRRNYSRIEEFNGRIIEDGGDISERPEQSLQDDVSDLVSAAAKATGLRYGTVKGDLVMDKSGALRVIEIAGRLSGGWLASHQIPASRGINLLKVAIRASIGEKIESFALIPQQHRAVSVRYWFPPIGKILSLSGVESLMECSGLVKAGIFREVGDFHPPVYSHADRFGYVIFSGDSSQEALARCKEGMSRVRIRVDAG